MLRFKKQIGGLCALLIDYLIFCIGLYSLVEIIDCRACIEDLDSS